jgi:hypothetical protein
VTRQGTEAAYRQQPELTCKALELVVRLHAANAVAGSGLVLSLSAVLNFCSTVLQLCQDAAAQLSMAASSAKGAVRQQLLSLVLSCSKLAAVRRDTEPGPGNSLALIARDEMMLGVQLSSGEADAGSSSSSCVGTAGAAQREAAYMSLVLVARGFLLAGQVLEATELSQCNTAEASDVLGDCRRAVCHLGTTLPAVELPGGPASEQGCAAARQQLLQLQAGLQQDLDAMVLDNTAAGSNSSSGSGSGAASAGKGSTALDMAAVPGLAQQLVALGGALCAQLPLQYCCNNPGCVELRGASELQLVGGKGSVCSRCRWVTAARQHVCGACF